MTPVDFFRALFIVHLTRIGVSALRQFRTGTIPVANSFGGSLTEIEQHTRPATFWAFVTLFYVVLGAAFALVTFAPAAGSAFFPDERWFVFGPKS